VTKRLFDPDQAMMTVHPPGGPGTGTATPRRDQLGVVSERFSAYFNGDGYGRDLPLGGAVVQSNGA
jgi:hypothetical protein